MSHSVEVLSNKYLYVYICYSVAHTQLFLIWHVVWITGRSTDSCIPAASMSGTATVLQQFVSGLKSRNEDTRAKAAKDLQHYVTTELREVNCTTLITPSIYIIKLHQQSQKPRFDHSQRNILYISFQNLMSRYHICDCLSVFKQTRKETCLQ